MSSTSAVPRLQVVADEPKPSKRPRAAIATRRANELAIGAAVWKAIRSELRRVAR